MVFMKGILVCLSVAFLASSAAGAADDPSHYVKKDTWQETVLASREALMKEEKARGGGVAVDFGQEKFTITAWIKTDSDGPIFVKTAGPGTWDVGAKVFSLAEDNVLYLVSVPRERAEDDPDRQTDENAFAGMAIALGQLGERDLSDGQWHHVAMTSAVQRHKFFVDGKPIESLTLWNFGKMGPDDPDHGILVGGQETRAFGQTNPGFTGDLDELQIFSRQLAPEEIAAIYGDPGAVKDGLAGWWSFEDGAQDASGYENHGEFMTGSAADGKFGNAMHVEGDGGATLPAMPGKEARDKILTLAARDFKDDESAQQIQWEKEDGIWKSDWVPGNLKELGGRYAKATRDVLGLPDKANELADRVRRASHLNDVREAYYSSRRANDALVAVSDKLNHMLEEIDYLADVHTPDDARWNDYKQSVAKLNTTFKTASAALDRGDASAVETLTQLQTDLFDRHDLLPHKLPSGADGPARFGAVHAKLKYTLEWDRRWRVSEDADVVVQFDEGPYKFVFWRGCSYIPCWATKHTGPWFTNEFFERRGWLGGGDSMMEPMSDKQCRYSHVRVVENHDARVVVHWRYTPCDLNYNVGYIDPETNWSDWADEYWTIYPDGIAMRKATLFSSGPLEDWIEYQESIFVNQPGNKPSDSVPQAAVTLANLDGETHTYTWERRFPPAFEEPTDPCIQLVNFFTQYKQFSVVTPEDLRVSAYPKDPRFDDDEYFNTWDAWPVSQDWSDARKATNFNKVSHGNLTHIVWKPYIENDWQRTWLMMTGMTDKVAGELAPVAKSWLHAPELKLSGSGYTSEGYDPAQRAYVLVRDQAGLPGELRFDLQASEDSPVVNLAFVVKDWGTGGANLALDGKIIPQGKDFRVGYDHGFGTSDLVVWLRVESAEPVEVTVSPQGK